MFGSFKMFGNEINLLEFGGLQPSVCILHYLYFLSFWGLQQSLVYSAGILTTISAVYWVRPHAFDENLRDPCSLQVTTRDWHILIKIWRGSVFYRNIEKWRKTFFFPHAHIFSLTGILANQSTIPRQWVNDRLVKWMFTALNQSFL